MSKNKAKKGSSRKLSSPSSEYDKAKERHCLYKHKNAKRKESRSDHVRQRRQDNYCRPSNEDVCQRNHQIKKTVYRRAETQFSEQRSAGNEDGHKRTRLAVTPCQGKTTPIQTKGDLPGKGTIIPARRNVESEPSSLLSSCSRGTLLQTKKRTDKHDPQRHPSHRDPTKVTTELIRSVSAEGENKKDSQAKRTSISKKAAKRKADEATETAKWGNTVSSAKKLKEKREGKPVAKLYKDERGDRLKSRGDVCARQEPPSKVPPDGTTEPSSTSAAQATSDQKSKSYKPLSPNLWKVAHVSTKTPGFSSVQEGEKSLTRPSFTIFKIPKKTQPLPLYNGNDDDNNNNYKSGSSTRFINCPTNEQSESASSPEDAPLQSVDCTAVYVSPSPLKGEDANSTISNQRMLQSTSSLPSYNQIICHEEAKDTQDNDEEMQVVEALHQARCERKLELNVVQSYGELVCTYMRTCMDTDPPDDGATNKFSIHPPDNGGTILVLDTNILLSHLEYVKKIISHGIGGMGFPVVLIPWMVLQELDSLKNDNRLQGSVGHLATSAIHHIYSCLKKQEPRLWGQSLQQAAECNHRLNAENNDDRILQCCLQYKSLYPESALILCTNDKNLCSKALLSGVKALSKADLEEESRTLHTGLPPPGSQHPPLSSAKPSAHNTSDGGTSHGASVRGKPLTKKQVGDGGKEADNRRVSLCVAMLENCLKEALSQILEVEMKAVYDDLWKDIIYLKPPWELPDVLQCLKKHWYAVFGNIVPRSHLQTVLNLNDFFTPGNTVECSSVLAALHQARELLEVFGKETAAYDDCVPAAISTMDTLLRQLQSKPENTTDTSLDTFDDVMSDNEEKLAPPTQASHQEVWALFENIWENVCQLSLAVFAALRFDPGTMRRTQPEGATLPQDALACLHKLSPMVTQLLEAFSRVLSSDIGMVEVQVQDLLSFIHATEIVTIQTRLSTKDILDCFSQQEYREKLRVGSAQLLELKVSLEHCIVAMNQSVGNTTWP